MIVSLAIRDIVLIDRLQMDFEDGLCVLSGETGAGKSILLSGIGLAVGARGERELVRCGKDQGSINIEIHVNDDHKVWLILDEQGLDYEPGQIIMRRIISSDGRSRAFINDQSVSMSLLRDVGESLIEIHGQHDERGLLNPYGHRDLLDEFGGYQNIIVEVRDNFENLSNLRAMLQHEKEKLETAKKDEDYIRHNLQELELLNPKMGEEEELSTERTRMMQGEALSEGLTDILGKMLNDKGIDTVLRTTMKKVERLSAQAPGLLDEVAETLDRAANETSDAISQFEQLIRDLEFNPYDLENIEERLFAIRAAARKHGCRADALVKLREEFEQKLNALTFGNEEISRLEKEVSMAQEKFEESVAILSKERKEAAETLDRQVNEELPALKMEKARFKTFLEPTDIEYWNAGGGERVDFRVSTNPGAAFGGLIKIASGGELSRFILALKVVLARKTSVATLIFDEIDQGVGGAVADAVGERLAELGKRTQVLVITHSPQVAARGNSHWLIDKNNETDADIVTTSVRSLNKEDRREEIARMLAGAEVTKEARAAADNLLRY